MPQIAITAEARSDFGKGASRRLRRAGFIPGVIYGKGAPVVHIALPERELLLALRNSKTLVLEVAGAGNGALVAPTEVQRDAVHQTLEHVDLVVLSKEEVAARIA